MWKYCLKKIVELAVVLLLISFFSFAVIYIAPGDISSMYISQEMTDEQKEAVLEHLGMDKSMPEQYLLKNVSGRILESPLPIVLP